MKTKFFKTIGVILLFVNISITSAQSPSLNFDGIDDYVNLGGIAGNNVRTIELWFSPTNTINNSITSPQSLVVRETQLDNSNEEFYLYFWSGDGRLRFTINPPGANQTVFSDSAVWNANQWYHVAAVIDPINGMRIFIDGVLQTSSNTYTLATSTIAGTMNNDYTALGVWGEFQQRFFAGQMDDVRFSSNAVYTTDFVPPCNLVATTTTIGLWSLDMGTGTTAVDSGNLGNNGTIEGPVWGLSRQCPSTSFCEDFNMYTIASPVGTGCPGVPVNNVLDNWGTRNTALKYENVGSQNGAGDTFLAMGDTFCGGGIGPTYIYNSTDYSGNWIQMAQTGGSLCYDFRAFSTQPGKFDSLRIYDNSTNPSASTMIAYFELNTPIDVANGWVNICAPIGFINNGSLPSNSFGQWVMQTGVNSDWDTLISNVGGIAYLVGERDEPEVYGLDNICIIPPCNLDPISGLTAQVFAPIRGTNTRKVILSWNGQTNISQYIINVYDNNGNLVNTLNTSNTTITTPLPPGKYTYTVTVVCANGDLVVSSSKGFRVRRLFFPPILLSRETSSAEIDFTMFPNPTITDVSVSLEGFDRNKSLDIIISDKNGRVMYSNSLKSEKHTVNIQDWSPGLYFCTILNNGEKVTKKLIKR